SINYNVLVIRIETLLKKWTNWDDTELITDIYDREIWKTFLSQIDTPDSLRFFTSKTADSHLGIMINLD
ncbi:6338_t:CDS:1, partial [Funneliformis geosporum]